METTLQVFNYNDTPVSFRLSDGQGVMINATEMAKPFGKRPVDYLRLPSTNELITAKVRFSHIAEDQLVMTLRGGTNPGTWMHEDIAIDFAQWLSVDFRLWVNDRIKELLKTGFTATSDTCLRAAGNPEFVLRVLDEIRDGYEQSLRLRQQNERLSEQLDAQAHKAAFYDKVHRCLNENEQKRIFRISQIAVELGLKAAELNRLLEQQGVQRRSGKMWVLTKAYSGKDYTRIKNFQNGFDEDGEPTIGAFMVWTAKGREFILGLFDK
uniref:KilA-N domain-containing protein n=1 Tax=Alistipes sp. D31t1_170403_E11 TaxID=2787128 RepID=UPI001897802D|nr:KilA-N domain-containing protein [Alistipes sp. D31t1_170403_E11]